MVIREADKIVARRMFEVAVGLVAEREADFEVRAAARAALVVPTAVTIRHLMKLGAGTPWLPSVIDALAEVGIAGAEDVLEGNE